MFLAEQARIVRSLVERVVAGPAGADIHLRVEGLAGLVRDPCCSTRGAEGRSVTAATSITVRVPLKIRRRPGRKTVVDAGGGGEDAAIPTRADPTLVKALARAFRTRSYWTPTLCLGH